MTHAQRLALARLRTADIVRRLVPYLNRAGYFGAIGVMLNVVNDIASEIVREEEEAIRTVEATLPITRSE